MGQVCTSCNKEKPLNKEHWHIKRATKTGYNTMCKVCRRNNQNKYYENNKEEINEKRREAYQENPEEILTKNMEYRRNNPDKVREWSKRYYNKNSEYIKEYNRKYSKENPQIINRQGQVRRARKRKLLADLTKEQWEDTLKYFNYKCSYCGAEGVPLQQDHVIPVYRKGPYTKSNIIPACVSCNSSKHIYLLEEWYPEQETYTEERMENIVQFVKKYLL